MDFPSISHSIHEETDASWLVDGDYFLDDRSDISFVMRVPSDVTDARDIKAAGVCAAIDFLSGVLYGMEARRVVARPRDGLAD